MFENHPWILKLNSFKAGIYTPLPNSSKNFLTNNLATYKDKLKMQLLRSCFSYQAICQALFKVRISSETLAVALLLSASNTYRYPITTPRPNPVVSCNLKGWELRVQRIELALNRYASNRDAAASAASATSNRDAADASDAAASALTALAIALASDLGPWHPSGQCNPIQAPSLK